VSHLEAVPLKPFGVEVHVDLRDELSTEAVEELRRLYAGHDLLVLRAQQLTMEEQVRALAHLGPILHVDNGLISRDSPIGLGGAELCFHSDYCYSPEPLHGISLHALDVVDGETSTRFASGRRAYDETPAELRRRLEGLEALQVFGARLDVRNRLADLDPRLPKTAHPLVQPHFGTGGSFLFAPEMTTDSIPGLPADEGEAIIQDVFGLLYDDANVLEHIWCIGDLVIWNNVTVVHARADNSRVDRRVLQRVTLGTKGYFDLYPWLADFDWDADGSLVASSPD
jgi:alpha-ketoglutarate-dependent taurine dioxygenase